MKHKTRHYSSYAGNAPYCYANSLVMVLGDQRLTAATVETLTGSPFGFQLLAGRIPLFDPFGWEPDIGLDQAIELLGYSHTRQTFDSAEAAVAELEERLQDGPVLLGPVDMGLLMQQPGSEGATGTDHFVAALDISSTNVTFHDPQGHPYATLPLETFCESWRGDKIGYLEGAYAMRTDFRQVERVSVGEAVRASVPSAAKWLAGRELPVPPGTVGGREGLERLAEIVTDELDDGIRELLINFSIRLGTRRRADAAECLAAFGETASAAIMEEQARTLGSLQYPAVVRDGENLAKGLQRLGQLHEESCRELSIAAEPVPLPTPETTG